MPNDRRGSGGSSFSTSYQRPKDPEAYTYLAKAQELGIKNVRVHKGPTIWPLDKDAFDVSDVDHAATDFPELNFIVEHVWVCRVSRTSASWRPRSPTCTPGCPWSSVG